MAGGVWLAVWVRFWEDEGEGVVIHCKWHLRNRIRLVVLRVVGFLAGVLRNNQRVVCPWKREEECG